MTNWRAYYDVTGGRPDLVRINRRIQLKYPGTDVVVTPDEFIAAKAATTDFLVKQRGPGDTSFLHQENSALIKLWPGLEAGRKRKAAS